MSAWQEMVSPVPVADLPRWNSEGSCNSNNVHAAKERKERKDKSLCFFHCDICDLLRPIHLWLRLASQGLLRLFCGKSIEMPFLQQFTTHRESFSIKVNQA